MWALGDKVASSIVAQSADIPTLPWSGSGDAFPLCTNSAINKAGVRELLLCSMQSCESYVHLYCFNRN